MAQDPKELIQSLGPKKARVDGDEVEAFSVHEAIAWDKYCKSNSSKSPFQRIARAKFTQPGPRSRFTDNPGCG